MPTTSTEVRKRILILHRKMPNTGETETRATRTAIYNLLNKYRKYHVYTDLPRAAQPKILNDEQIIFIDNKLAKNDELTARQMHELLVKNGLI